MPLQFDIPQPRWTLRTGYNSTNDRMELAGAMVHAVRLPTLNQSERINDNQIFERRIRRFFLAYNAIALQNETNYILPPSDNRPGTIDALGFFRAVLRAYCDIRRRRRQRSRSIAARAVRNLIHYNESRDVAWFIFVRGVRYVFSRIGEEGRRDLERPAFARYLDQLADDWSDVEG